MNTMSHMSALALVLLAVVVAPPSRGPHPPVDLDAHEEA